MIILIDTDDKIIEVDHIDNPLLTYNTLAELLMNFAKYEHISLAKLKAKKKVTKVKIIKDIKPTENNIKK